MPVEQPSPSMELLQEEYLLVEAWKKTAGHLRAHNWFADSLAIDLAAVELPRFWMRWRLASLVLQTTRVIPSARSSTEEPPPGSCAPRRATGVEPGII